MVESFISKRKASEEPSKSGEFIVVPLFQAPFILDWTILLGLLVLARQQCSAWVYLTV